MTESRAFEIRYIDNQRYAPVMQDLKKAEQIHKQKNKLRCLEVLNSLWHFYTNTPILPPKQATYTPFGTEVVIR